MPVDPLAKAMFPIRSRSPGADAAMPQPTVVGDGRDLVLLVEDHDMVRATTAETLVELGYRVVEARSGEEALRLLDGGLDADLMVTDLVMPGLSGVEVAALARSRCPGLPVLLVSGQPDPEGVPADLPCLTKPYRRSALADSLADLPRRVRGPAAEAVV